MTTVNWHGPYTNPFKATVKAMDHAGLDTVEFSSYRMWDAAGEYDFHTQADTYIDSVCAWLAEQCGVTVRHGADGFYATVDVVEGRSQSLAPSAGMRPS